MRLTLLTVLVGGTTLFTCYCMLSAMTLNLASFWCTATYSTITESECVMIRVGFAVILASTVLLLGVMLCPDHYASLKRCFTPEEDIAVEEGTPSSG